MSQLKQNSVDLSAAIKEAKALPPSDGGYERGYAEGYAAGYAAGLMGGNINTSVLGVAVLGEMVLGG